VIDVAISYFYQIRFFKPYMVPISTAVWDPKWYHSFKDQNHVFIDRNGVINGLRIKPLMPGDTCAHLCRGREYCASSGPDTCTFLQNYYMQLEALDFNEFMWNLEKHLHDLFEKCHIESEPLAVLMVHEAFSNPCSERVALLKWFSNHGLPVSELRYPISANY